MSVDGSVAWEEVLTLSIQAAAFVMTEPEQDALDTFMQFRCSTREKRWIEAGAAKRGLKPAAFVRMVLYDRLNSEGVPMPPKEKKPKR